MQTFQTEQDIRSLVDEQLRNLGWHMKLDSRRNVFQEQPRTTEEKKKLLGKRPDYVLYPDPRKDPFARPLAIIETKKPGVSLDKALEQAGWYAQQLNAPLVFATDGIYYKTFHMGKQKPLYLNGEEVDELVRELEALRFLNDNELNTISKEVVNSRHELIKIFEESNNLLRDEGLRAGIERFGEFANILFLKLISEVEDLKDSEGGNRTNLLKRYLRWNEWKSKNGEELLSFVNDTVLPKIGENYKDKDIFLPLTIKHPDVLKKIIDKLDPLNLINIDSDIKGDSFEYFLKRSTATKNDLGEYFTPRHVVKVMVKLANPQIGEKVYDPFCGTGGTLIESFRHISTNMARTPANWKRLKETTLYGNEITSTARITKMNMILAGDGHSGITQTNSLKNPIHDRYDVVITNMPYSQKTEYGGLYDLPSMNGDSICVQHCIEAVRKTSDNGRMVLVVPEGFLFRKDLEKTRKYLLDSCVVKSIISLPQGVFLPYTSVKTDILYCTDVKQKIKQEKMWYFNVRNDGYSLDNHRRKLDGESDFQKFLEYRNLDAQDSGDVISAGFSQLSLSDVKANGYVLSGNKYNLLTSADTTWQLVKLRDVATIVRGVTYSQADESDGETDKRILRANNIDRESRALNLEDVKFLKDEFNIVGEKMLKHGDLLVCTSSGSKAHLGKSTYITEDAPYYAGGFMSIVRPNPAKIVPAYLNYIFGSVPFRDYVGRITNGSSINNLRIADVGAFELPLPPIATQEKIVSELQAYQIIIDNARSTITAYRPNIDLDAEWPMLQLQDVATIKPPKSEVSELNKSTTVSFVPMASIKEHSASFEAHETKSLSEVSSGYTYFRDNDVLLAKITPCFENGKSGIARQLKNGIGFGSTEFIVIRPSNRVLPEWVYYFISQDTFLSEGKTTMTGSAGQQRITTDFVSQYTIPVPTIDVQKSIVSRIEQEQALIKPSQDVIKVFEKKISAKLDAIWHG